MSTKNPEFEGPAQQRDRIALDDRAKIDAILEEKRQVRIRAVESVRTQTRDDPFHPAFLTDHDQWYGYKCGKRILANTVLGLRVMPIPFHRHFNKIVGVSIGIYFGLDYCGEEASYLSAASRIRRRLSDYRFMQPYLAVNRFNPQTENRGLREGQTGPMPHYIDDRRPT